MRIESKNAFSHDLTDVLDIADSEAQEFYSALIADVEAEVEANDSVSQRFTVHRWVSKSKGRGRPRKYWKEIVLIHDKRSGIMVSTIRIAGSSSPSGSIHRIIRRTWTSSECFNFDVLATEVLPGVHPTEAEPELRRRLGV